MKTPSELILSATTVLSTPPPRGLWQRARRQRSLMVGLTLTLLLLGTAALSLLWTPWPPAVIDVRNKLQGPSLTHWLGTDQLGRDTLSLIMAGARNSIMVGLIAVGIGLFGGVLLGMLAAARGGWLDSLIMRATDFTLAFPAILLAIMLTAALGPGIGNAILAIGLANIPIFARLSRACARSMWQREFVLAARSCGKSNWSIACQHILPNILSVLVVQATIEFAIAILAEAALSYLGLGTQPPHASWGRMLAEAQMLMFQAPRLAVYPGLAIALAVLGLNLLGDGLRDLLDPRLSRRR
jgi:peptide/nickel transport system permease protein